MATRVGAVWRGRLGTNLLCGGGPSLFSTLLIVSWDLYLGELFIHARCCHSREPLGGRPEDLCEDRI